MNKPRAECIAKVIFRELRIEYETKAGTDGLNWDWIDYGGKVDGYWEICPDTENRSTTLLEEVEKWRKKLEEAQDKTWTAVHACEQIQ